MFAFATADELCRCMFVRVQTATRRGLSLSTRGFQKMSRRVKRSDVSVSRVAKATVQTFSGRSASRNPQTDATQGTKNVTAAVRACQAATDGGAALY